MELLHRVTDVRKQTDNKFLNMYELEGVQRNGEIKNYFMASRFNEIDKLRVKTGSERADAVLIYAVAGDKLVLEKQYRFPIDGYLYECPAGLWEEGESMEEAAAREFFEETGMKFTPYTDHNCSRAYYPSIGVTDEAISTVFGYAEGEPTSVNQEDSEDITVVLADRAECIRILKEESVSVTCAFLLFSFIASSDDEPFAFLV